MDKLRSTLNNYGRSKTAIFFIIDFSGQNYFITPLQQIQNDPLIQFQFGNSCANTYTAPHTVTSSPLIQHAIPFEHYKQLFIQVQEQIKQGNTYLLNLTFPTIIQTPLSLTHIYQHSQALFKVLFCKPPYHFVCFSPERFIKIDNNIISTYPIKGTIDANTTNAKATILADVKEMAEHTMIVDLLRNDLGMVANNITVRSFRDVNSIHAGDKQLLQVNSTIQGQLPQQWYDNLGNIITALLPAGSISGTPKKKSIDIINTIEQQYNGYQRGFYCGICGYFNGHSLDSFVLIRFIEEMNGQFVYKSGGGITIDSDVYKEYKELIDKIYIPL